MNAEQMMVQKLKDVLDAVVDAYGKLAVDHAGSAVYTPPSIANAREAELNRRRETIVQLLTAMKTACFAVQPPPAQGF